MIRVRCRSEDRWFKDGVDHYSPPRVTGEVEIRSVDERSLTLTVELADGMSFAIQISPDSADDVAGALRTVAERVRRQISEQRAAKKP